MIISAPMLLFLCALSWMTFSSAQTATNAPSSSELEVSARVVGGTRPARSRFPYYVRVDKDGGLHCGGTLIAPGIVLTAAHCIVGGGILTAYADAYNIYTSYQGMESRSVVQAIAHPYFNPATMDHDYGLLKLSSSVTTATIPLNGDSSIPSPGDSLIVMGVGDAVEGGGSTVYLNSAKVDMVSYRVCNSEYRGGIIDATMFCARASGRDSCQGDSGGPIVERVNGVETLVGIVSWGLGCAQAQYPGVYSRVSAAKSWIDRTMVVMGSTASTKPPNQQISQPNPQPTKRGCTDDKNAKFYINNVPNLTCDFIKLFTFFQAIVCQPGNPAYTACSATCGACRSASESDSTQLKDAESTDTSPSEDNSTTVQPIPFRVNCDDNQNETFFVNVDIGEVHCAWLNSRPSWQTELCVPSHSAYSICEETCGVCVNSCKDTTYTFKVDGVVRDCLWLSVRPLAQAKVCHDQHPAWAACPEVCESCKQSLTDLSSPSSAPSSSVCDDSESEKFFVDESLGEQPCVWLKSRPQWQEKVCQPGSAAWDTCPETCGVCSDTCQDGTEKFVVDGGTYDCLWLSLRPEVQDILCTDIDTVENQKIRSICGETCNVCG